MLPTSLAFAWLHWRKHRWGHMAVLGYLLVAGILSALLAPRTTPEVAGGIIGPITLPLVALGVYLPVVFCYGVEAQVGGRESCFPSEMFRLPVSTGALVRWPMVWGAAAAALLWLAAARFIIMPWVWIWGAEVPLWWPALLATAGLAWVQALLWAPFGLRWLRVILIVIFVPGMIVVAESSVLSGASEASLVGLFGSLTLAGWGLGYAGVRHGRRGDVPNWDGILHPLRQLVRGMPRRRQVAWQFASAGAAQTWFEFRRTGKSLPIMTALVLPFVLLFLGFGANPVIPTAQTLVSALLLPVFLAGMAGTMVSSKNPWVKDYYGVAPFTATLPVSTAGLLAAKLRGAARSTLVTWAIVIVTTTLAVVVTGNQEEVAGWWQQALNEHHPFRIVAGIAGTLALLMVFTWKRLFDSLFLGLTGRKWVIQVSLIVGAFVFCVLCAVGGWIHNHAETWETFRAMLPWLLALLIACRLLAASWVVRKAIRRRLLDEKTVLCWLVAWLLLAVALFGLLACVVPTEVVPLHYVAFAVVLSLPMTRLAASPLVLAWNRHR
jgi:hypothetical protein